MINITFTDEIEIITSTEHLYQWDVGQVLEIDGLNVGTPIIHFGIKGDAVGYGVQSQIVDGKLRCGIPDVVLQSGKQIIAYIYVSAGASKYTDRVILIPVVERNKPSNYRTVNMDEVTETQSFFDSMVDRLTKLEKRVPISFWTGTQEQYDALSVKQNNCLYIVTDNPVTEEVFTRLNSLEEDVEDAWFHITDQSTRISDAWNEINLHEDKFSTLKNGGELLYEGVIETDHSDSLSVRIPRLRKYTLLGIRYGLVAQGGSVTPKDEVLCLLTEKNGVVKIHGTYASANEDAVTQIFIYMNGRYETNDGTGDVVIRKNVVSAISHGAGSNPAVNVTTAGRVVTAIYGLL